MSIDNRSHIKTIIESLQLQDGEFLPASLIIRRKDGIDITNNSRIIASYDIRSSDDLDNPLLVTIAQATGARLYINLNARTDRAVAFEMLKRLATSLATNEYRTKNIRQSVIDSTPRPRKKLWVVDYDYGETAWSVIDLLDELERHTKVVAELPTKNGVHFIVEPFNRAQASLSFVNMIKSDTYTLAYVP